jgi:membrane protein DedA with SNARE-associated domain
MSFLASVWLFFEASKYPLLFVGCFIEGTVIMMAAGLLWHQGLVEFWPAYIALLAADFLADIMWYVIGYYGARKFVNKWGHHVGMTQDNLAKVERRFHKHHIWILLISKLSMGFGLAVATLTTAGMLRIPFYRYMTINVLGGFVWVYAMMLVGYYFGNVLALIPREFQIGFAVLVLILVFFGLQQLNKRLATLDW